MTYNAMNPVTVRPSDLKPGDMLGFKVIAVIGPNGDWAVYRGLTSWSDDEVAASGDKISEDIANSLFYAPRTAGLNYRGG